MTQSNRELDRTAPFQVRIRTALSKLDETSRDTNLRAVLSGYYRFIGRSMAKTGGVEFPRSLRRHPLHTDRGTEGDSKGLVLMFHIGNAIYTMYEASSEEIICGNTIHTMTPKQAAVASAKVEDAYTRLEQRTRLLELLAQYGLKEFLLDGTPATGFVLMPSKAIKDVEAVRLHEQKIKDDLAAKELRIARRAGQFPASVAREAAIEAEDQEDGFKLGPTGNPAVEEQQNETPDETPVSEA